MPRKKTPEQLRRSKLRSLHRAVKVVENQLNDSSTDKIRIAPLAKSLAALHRQMSKLEKEESEPMKRPVGRPKLSVRLVRVSRRLDGRMYALYETSAGRDLLIDLPISSGKLISRVQALSLTLHQAESKAEELLAAEDKPKPSREEILRVCALLGCSNAHPCVLCKPYRSDPNAAPDAAVPADSAPDAKPAADSTPVAESADDPADPSPVEAQSEQVDPVLAADVSPAVEQVDSPDIPKLKTEVQKLRDWCLQLYAVFAQNPLNKKAVEEFDNHQTVFIETAAKLKELAPEAYRELLEGYEHLLLISSAPEGKPSIDIATQTIAEARFEASTRPKKKHDDEPRGPLGSWTKF